MFKQLALIGCGLMGGSFALALKRARLVEQVVGHSKSAASTALAQRLGVVDSCAETALAAVSGADLVLVAVPVSATEACLTAIRPGLRGGALLMDVGSTKCDVVDTARHALGVQFGQFVPAHPIAGSEQAGVAHADAGLYEGRQVILTPLAQTRDDLVRKAAAVWTAIGAKVRQMSPERHDAAFAAVSHLPHLLAFACFSSVADQPDGQDHLSLAGPGFRDFTRIAASDPAVWRDILLANREQVLQQNQRFRLTLDALEQAMLAGDAQALEDMIRKASSARNAWQIGGAAR